MTTIEMSNYLFFRTDRIGDFLVSAILINSIKRNDLNSMIYVKRWKDNSNTSTAKCELNIAEE